jgi:CRISPR system Cascade subunit CasE
MYLSRLVLNPRNSGARHDAAVPYELHRTLMRGLDHHEGEGRLLFRQEPERGRSGPVVLVQTLREPNWTSLLENGYLLRFDGPKQTNPQITEGQRLRFRLRANPVKKVSRPQPGQPKRIPLLHASYSEEQQGKDPKLTGYLDWLTRQAQRHGFAVESVRDSPEAYPRKKNEKPTSPRSKAEIPHFGVRFDGVLEVRDAEAFARALRQGVGPAKAFGFGLLSVATLRSA